MLQRLHFSFFFFNDTATTEIYTLSLHDALPIYLGTAIELEAAAQALLMRSEDHAEFYRSLKDRRPPEWTGQRSEEHTSELQSPCNLVCRLLLEKKKKKNA